MWTSPQRSAAVTYLLNPCFSDGLHDDAVELRRVEEPGRRRGDRAVARLRGSARTRMTTDEILALTRQP